ncbi:MAG: AraC family transcriptional regulator [Myxococcota bacterium]
MDAWPIVAQHQSHHAPLPHPGPVTHSYAALGFHTGGHVRVEQNGEWKLSAGDVLLVPAGQPHRMIEMKRSEYWGVAFCVPCLIEQGAAELLAPFERVRDGASAVVRIPAARHTFLQELFKELEDAGRAAAGERRQTVQRSLLTLILHEVDRAAEHPETGAGGVVAESLRFIEHNCLKPLTLRDVAAAVGRTPAYVTSALSKATGRSAVQWIVAGRMAEARRRLLHTDEMVDVIAERVGYADATHFIRMFRRAHGITPAAWRATHRPREFKGSVV